MRIVSTSKDYYDYISHTLGADPNVVYLRGKTAEPCGVKLYYSDNSVTRVAVNTNDAIVLRMAFSDTDRQDARIGKESTFYYRGVIVAGEHTFTTTFCEKYLYDKDSPAQRQLTYKSIDTHTLDLPKGVRERLTKLVGRPVFLLVGCEHSWQSQTYYTGYINSTPNLRGYGVDKHVTPQQMWQSIYTVLTNVLRDNPDKQPPHSVNNTERILAAGFDLKTSFRKR